MVLEKNPFIPSLPEPALEGIGSEHIIVIQPGSYFLRIGFASEPYPYSIPHCIARRLKKPSIPKREEPWIFRPVCKHIDAKKQRQGLKNAEESLKTKTTSSGSYRKLTPYQQLLALNKELAVTEAAATSSKRWTDTTLKFDYLIGEEAMHVNPADCYSVQWPIRNGRLNVHHAVHGSLSSVLQDLYHIWTKALQSYLSLPLKSLKKYRAVLLIADNFERTHVKGMMDLLLNLFGFQAAFCHQESVCATYGAGVPSACVVDIGDQKTSVCCVEDGISLRNTRLTMEFGGSDVTRCLFWLLKRGGFPYKECHIVNRLDALFLQKIKEAVCHLEIEEPLTKLHKLVLESPNGSVTEYSMHVGDEALLAPLGLYYPDLMGLHSKDLCHVPSNSASDPSDPFDDDYLIQVQRKQEMAARLNAARKREKGQAADVDDDEDDMDAADGLEGKESLDGGQPAKMFKKEDDLIDMNCGVIGIDQAILRSIEKCDAEEIRKRMYSCIVVVGGGMLLNGAGPWLKTAVWSQMPSAFRSQLETMDVITYPKEMDPRIACWKGGAVLGCLDTAQELWIQPGEWLKFGAKMLRERAPFNW